MADKELHELTSWTPALTDITVFWWPSGWAEVKKSTFSSIKDLLKTSYDALYQAILVSGTNIKTVNGNTLLWSGNLALPVLSDWNYTDATISSSGTVITINNWVVTNAKLANVSSATFKWRTTVGTGDPEDMTATQATALLNTATTSLKGLMSSADKIKLDTIPSSPVTKKWCLVQRYADQSITSITWTAVSFDTETNDTSSYYSSWTDITIQENWLYSMTWVITYDLFWSSTTLQVEIYRNWGVLFHNDVVSSSWPTSVYVSWDYYLFSWDVIKLLWYHNGWWSTKILWWEWKVFLNIYK